MNNKLSLTNDDSKLTPIEIALEIDKEGRTTARKLYEWLELNVSNYAKWIKRNIIDNQFAEKDKDFYSYQSTNEGRGNFAEDYKLTAEFAKKLAMTTKSIKGEEARTYFISVEEKLKEVAKTMNFILTEEDKYALSILHANSKEEIMMIIKQHEEEVVKPLRIELDKYERFLCKKTELLTKTQLATKLDTSTGTLASLFKKLGIYTPKSSKLKEEFLELFPNIKMFDETDESYKDKNTGKVIPKTGWQWTFLGAKNLIDYLDSLGYITYTENAGFKLKKC